MYNNIYAPPQQQHQQQHGIVMPGTGNQAQQQIIAPFVKHTYKITNLIVNENNISTTICFKLYSRYKITNVIGRGAFGIVWYV